MAESLNFQLMGCPEVFVPIQSKTQRRFQTFLQTESFWKTPGWEHQQLEQPTWNLLHSHSYRKRKGYEATHSQTGSRTTRKHTFGQSQLGCCRPAPDLSSGTRAQLRELTQQKANQKEIKQWAGNQVGSLPYLIT